MDDVELEIDWIPEDTGAPYEAADDEFAPHQIDELCQKKYGHTDWARMSAVTPFDLHNNPGDNNYEKDIELFHKEINVWKLSISTYTQKVHEQILQALGITRSTGRKKNSRPLLLYSETLNPKKNKKVLNDGDNVLDCEKLKKVRETLP